MLPTQPNSTGGKLWTWAVYALLTVIAVLFWFAYRSDSFTAAGGDPAGNGMSRAFGQLLCIAAGVLSLPLGAVALRVRNLEIKAVLLVLMAFIALLLGAMI
jgi:hypothetical protein